MEKVIAYKSSDGKFFMSREECRKHEAEKDFRYFRSNGEVADDVDDAIFVYIKSDEASEYFNETYGYHTIGEGLYVWSGWRDDYLYWREVVETYETSVNPMINIQVELEEEMSDEDCD